MDVEKWLSFVEKCQKLKEREMVKLIHSVKEVLIEEPNLLRIQSPIVVCGDIHGQFFNLTEILKLGGRNIAEKNYLFLGDYVDRGFHSIEVLTYLMLLKVKYPKNIHLLRGNHENRQITQIYGFYDACTLEYGNPRIYNLCCKVFDLFSLAAVIDNEIFAVHGGISQDLPHIEQIQCLNRRIEPPTTGPITQLLWADPDENITYFSAGRRGNELFGWKAARKFCRLNNINLICRSHQMVEEGYRYSFEDKNVVTIFSAANYCYRCGNQGGIMIISSEDRKFITYRENEEQIKTTIQRQNQSTPPQYFL